MKNLIPTSSLLIVVEECENQKEKYIQETVGRRKLFDATVRVGEVTEGNRGYCGSLTAEPGTSLVAAWCAPPTSIGQP